MSWSARQYVKFEDERTRPVRDLLAGVPTVEPRRVVDLGCGPGNSTEVLAQRFPGAAVHGVDSSEEMVQAARARLPALSFQVADIDAWAAPSTAADNDDGWDVILANAVLQWLPDHRTTLRRLAARLAPGGSLAVQMPDNLGEPCHVHMREIARSGAWAARLAPVRQQRTDLDPPAGYYALLRPGCARVDVWRTTYHHPLAGVDAVVEWFKGSGLRPFLEPLAAAEREEFLGQYRARLAESYPVQPDGMVLLPFPRLFIVATR